MAEGFDRLLVEAVHRMDVVGANICHCVFVEHSGSGGSEIAIVCRFLYRSVVVAVGAVDRSSPTRDFHCFFVEHLDGSVSQLLDAFHNALGNTPIVKVGLGGKSKDEHFEVEKKLPEGCRVRQALWIGFWGW